MAWAAGPAHAAYEMPAAALESQQPAWENRGDGRSHACSWAGRMGTAAAVPASVVLAVDVWALAFCGGTRAEVIA